MAKQLQAVFNKHGLSIVTIAILALWLVLYTIGDPKTHWGAFFGNAIADWSGVVLMVLGTKFFMERGSKETTKQRDQKYHGFLHMCYEHSFSLFVIVTLIGWILLFNHMDPNEKWGQVAGNVVSEWVQALGLIFLTKRLYEQGSEESKG